VLHQRYNRDVERLSGPYYMAFINSIRSPATKAQYAYCILNYMHFLNVQETSDIMFNSDLKTIEQHLIEYMVYLKPRIAYSTRMVYCSAVVTFYTMNDILVNKKKLYRYLGEQTRGHRDRAYTTEEIAKLVDGADLRMRSIVLFLSSTGCRLGAIPLLKLSNLKLCSEYDLYQVTIYENTKDEYYTFTTPECKRAIDAYLEYRERSGERLSPSSPLFREQFDINDPFQISKPRTLHTNSLHTMFNRALIKAGLKTVEHATETSRNRGRIRKEVAIFNGFRKFANTNFVRAKVNPAVKEMLMGHSIELDDNYYRPSQEEVLSEYVKAVDMLTINDENRLKRKVVELKLNLDKFSELEEKMDRLSKMMGLD
jgi:integrase